MALELQFCLLGPMVVRRHGAVVPVQAGKQRALLARLLLDANQVVSVDDLAEALWGADPPPSARASIRNYVKRLRQTLGEDGRARIVTESPGYLIRAAPGELDVARFESLLRSAREAARARSWDHAAGQARAALALWQGEPLADVASEQLALREGGRLAELKLRALETRIDADLHLGGHADVVAELERLVAAHPLREHLHALLMLALYLSGRQAEALGAYQRARRTLISELGAEPAAELRELHRRILAGDRTLAGPPAARGTVAAGPGPAAGPGSAVPRELPAAVRHFTGRARELTELTRLLDRAGKETPAAPLVSLISGTGGVGKTALALHWAHRMAGRFPGGQLYVNLRGYDPGQPVAPPDALARFLRALGVPAQEVPAETDELATRYRSLLTGRKMLIVLDNASDAEQVRPLLPGTPACVTVVTSRDALPGLVARDGATRLELHPMSRAEAAGLLRALAGPRAAADPAAGELVARCCGLPLALRVAAELVTSHPGVPLGRLAGELAAQRLDLLDVGGDPRTAVRAVFSWSYRHLDAAPARLFRLAGLHPGPDIEPCAAAALAGTTIGEAGRLLGVLARAHLIQPTGPGRYGMHDLLRGYASDVATGEDGEQARHAALTRLFDHYLHTAATAMDTLFPAERYRRPRVPDPGTPAAAVTGVAGAQAWLDAEGANLIAAAAHAADHGWPGHAIMLSATLFRYLDTCGYFAEAVTLHGHALRAARATGDRSAEGAALTSLGLVDGHQGRHQRAIGHFEQALGCYRQTGELAGQARALNYLGLIDLQRGRYRPGAGKLEQALTLFREAGERTGEAYALSNLGVIEARLGQHERATWHQQQALALLRESGDRHGEATVLGRLGLLDLRQGNHQRAIAELERALRLFRQFGDQQGEATVLGRLGLLDLRQGNHQRAAAEFRRALTRYRELGDPAGEAEALNGLGEVLAALGRFAGARAEHAAALGLASQAGDQAERARAHDGLARSYQADGDPARARGHWQQALNLYTELGDPAAQQVRARLSAADGAGQTPDGAGQTADRCGTDPAIPSG